MRRNGRESLILPHTDSSRGQDASLSIGICTAVIGSMTQAMRAQSVLADTAIRASITKISSTMTHNGCAYGVVFPCTQNRNARMVLNRAGIKVRQYLQE